MTKFIGQITVILKSANATKAEMRLRDLAKRIEDISPNVVFADHNGDVENYDNIEAECAASTKTSPKPVIRFDSYEIQGVRTYGRGKARYCETVDDTEAQFWSLYGHIPEQGAICIGNFKTRELAGEMYTRITGAPFAVEQFVQPAYLAESHRNENVRASIAGFALRRALSECVRILADYEDADGEEGDAYRQGIAALGLSD